MKDAYWEKKNREQMRKEMAEINQDEREQIREKEKKNNERNEKRKTCLI